VAFSFRTDGSRQSAPAEADLFRRVAADEKRRETDGCSPVSSAKIAGGDPSPSCPDPRSSSCSWTNRLLDALPESRVDHAEGLHGGVAGGGTVFIASVRVKDR
jgi:hypothetical protein